MVDGLHPMTAATTENGTPDSSIRVQAVCLRSWTRQVTPARILAASHASFQLPIGRVGSVAYGPPSPYFSAGKMKCSGLRDGKLAAHCVRIVRARSFSGISRPSPYSVVLAPTRNIRLLKLI